MGKQQSNNSYRSLDSTTLVKLGKKLSSFDWVFILIKYRYDSRYDYRHDRYYFPSTFFCRLRYSFQFCSKNF